MLPRLNLSVLTWKAQDWIPHYIQSLQYHESQLYILTRDSLFLLSGDSDLLKLNEKAEGMREFSISPSSNIAVTTNDQSLWWWSPSISPFWKHENTAPVGLFVLTNRREIFSVLASHIIWWHVVSGSVCQAIDTSRTVQCLTLDKQTLWLGFHGSIGFCSSELDDFPTILNVSDRRLSLPVSPTSIVVHNDELYVADSANKQIMVMSQSGVVRQMLHFQVDATTRLSISKENQMSVVHQGKLLVRLIEQLECAVRPCSGRRSLSSWLELTLNVLL
jgi:hypothetical protein